MVVIIEKLHLQGVFAAFLFLVHSVGVLAAMHAPVEGAIDVQTREMLLALGYARAEEDAVVDAEPLDAKDIARAHYLHAGLKGTVAFQSKLAPDARNVRLIRRVEREASRLHDELPEVQALATLAADARRLLEQESE